MKESAAMHDEAMSLLDQVYIAKSRNDSRAADELTRQAFELEMAAALRLRDSFDLEPSRSIMFKSAAILGMQAGRYREAEQLAAAGLSGNCHEGIATELRQLMKNAAFRQTLKAEQTCLSDDKLSLSLDGDAVGYGVVTYEQFHSKIGAAIRLMSRTSDRLLGLDFKTGAGRPLKKQVVPYLSAPQASSFAVDLMHGSAESQMEIFSVSAKVMMEVVECFELLQERNRDALKRRIGDEQYFANFVGLARELLPDGVAISSVKLEAQTAAGNRRVLVTRTRAEAIPNDTLVSVEARKVIVSASGTLRLANGIGNKHEVGLESLDGARKVATFIVPPEMMDDIVKPRWGQHVRMVGYADEGRYGKSPSMRRVVFSHFEDVLEGEDSPTPP